MTPPYIPAYQRQQPQLHPPHEPQGTPARHDPDGLQEPHGPARSRPAHHGPRHGHPGPRLSAQPSPGHALPQPALLPLQRAHPGGHQHHAGHTRCRWPETGWTVASGYNIIVTARRGKTRLLVVVMGGRSRAARDMVAHSLIEAGFKAPASPQQVRKRMRGVL